ncbi:hypothetical protein LEP1GSC062_1872 [Leptospira alexanderi serovar Manhao 3 str. L 60]|uniref:Uncharacterized protein n=1 Tax=Leptospira alexanderi serovar Manhao 3 str. L 60 TaxID=1049759 RepID=V6HUF4_9LEPT|nr:hypothetical protein LEP1GSC062_1872 [Leptospira alexanderi serovar Manhao 3 str. L 60]
MEFSKTLSGELNFLLTKNDLPKNFLKRNEVVYEKNENQRNMRVLQGRNTEKFQIHKSAYFKVRR